MRSFEGVPPPNTAFPSASCAARSQAPHRSCISASCGHARPMSSRWVHHVLSPEGLLNDGFTRTETAYVLPCRGPSSLRWNAQLTAVQASPLAGVKHIWHIRGAPRPSELHTIHFSTRSSSVSSSAIRVLTVRRCFFTSRGRRFGSVTCSFS